MKRIRKRTSKEPIDIYKGELAQIRAMQAMLGIRLQGLELQSIEVEHLIATEEQKEGDQKNGTRG